MEQPAEGGATNRAHLMASAKHSPFSRQQLEPPEMPCGGDYLYDWHQDVSRGLGRSEMSGALAPLTWEALDAWARRTGAAPEPHEQDALFQMDTARRHPELFEEPA